VTGPKSVLVAVSVPVANVSSPTATASPIRVVDISFEALLKRSSESGLPWALLKFARIDEGE
jgi:hypothetical protein